MGDHDRLHRLWPAADITDRHLAFGIRPQIAVFHRIALAEACQLLDDFVGVVDGGRHHVRSFIAGVAEHHALVAGPLFGEAAHPLGHALRDVRGLPVDADHHLRVVGAEPHRGVVIADFPDRIQRDILPVHLGTGGDFPRDHHQVGGGQRFTGHTTLRILRQTGVEDRVGNLVAHLIRMPFGNRFRSEHVLCTNLAHLSFLLFGMNIEIVISIRKTPGGNQSVPSSEVFCGYRKRWIMIFPVSDGESASEPERRGDSAARRSRPIPGPRACLRRS